MIDITPFVESSELKEAVDHDRINKVEIVQFDQPNDRTAVATSRWVPAGAFLAVKTLRYLQQSVDLSGQLSNLSESLGEFFEELEALTSAPTAPQLSAGSPLPNVAGALNELWNGVLAPVSSILRYGALPARNPQWVIQLRRCSTYCATLA